MENAITQEVNGFERILAIQHPFDKRDADPAKNYGISSMGMTFCLRKDGNAIAVTIATGTHLLTIVAEMISRGPAASSAVFEATGMSLTSHWATEPPEDIGHEQYNQRCIWLDWAPCHCNVGSQHAARVLCDLFIEKGPDALWEALELAWMNTFAQPVTDSNDESAPEVAEEETQYVYKWTGTQSVRLDGAALDPNVDYLEGLADIEALALKEAWPIGREFSFATYGVTEKGRQFAKALEAKEALSNDASTSGVTEDLSNEDRVENSPEPSVYPMSDIINEKALSNDGNTIIRSFPELCKPPERNPEDNYS